MSLDHAETVGYIDSLDKDAKAIRSDLLSICWYMRGGITYDDAMLLSRDEREIISKIIKDNLETTKESGLPFF